MTSVVFDYSTIKAEVGQRLLAHLIDILVAAALTVPFLVIFSLIFPDLLGLMAAGSFFLITYISYLSLMEGTRFTTIGKKIFDIYVLNLSLEPISLRQALIRNVMRIADSIFVYLPLFSRDGRRLGDGAAGTIVVSEKAIRPRIPSLSLCKRILRTPEGVFTREKALIKAFLSELEKESELISEDAFNEIEEALGRKLKVDIEYIHHLAADTFLLEENKIKAALLALALMTRTVVFKEEKALKVAQEIYKRASEMCQESGIRSHFQMKARGLESLIEIKSGFRNHLELKNLLKTYSSVIPVQFRENLHYFLFSVILFTSATFLGYYKLEWLADFFKKAIVPAGETIEKLSPSVLFLMILLNNVRVSMAMCGGGASVFITPILLMINGLIVGSVGKAMRGLGRFLLYYTGIIPHGFLELSAFFMSSASGLRAARSILFPYHGLSRYESLKKALDTSFELGLGSILFLVPAAVIESFITERLIGNPKYATYVGVGVTSLLYIYLLLSGRKRKDMG